MEVIPQNLEERVDLANSSESLEPPKEAHNIWYILSGKCQVIAGNRVQVLTIQNH